MAFSLVEAAKLQSTEYRAGIFLTLAASTPLMERIKWLDIKGKSLDYNLQTAISGVGFRNINETLNQSNLVIQNSVEILKIMQTKAEVDRAMIKTRNDGDALRKSILKDKLAALAYEYTYNFFKGDVAVDSKGFDGLEKRLVGRQVLDCEGTLTLEKLDEALLRVSGPNNKKTIFMGNTDYVQFRKLVREQGTEIVGTDSFGNQIYKYGDAEVVRLDVYDKGDQETGLVETIDILGKNETFNTVPNTSSIYIVAFGDGENGVTGLQNDSGIDVRQYNVEPNEITDVEWINGFGLFHPRAAARLAGITA